MKMIYRPGLNRLIVSALRPFSSILPDALKIPVNGKFSFRLHNGKSMVIHANPTNYLAKQLFWNGIESYEFEVVKLFSEMSVEAKSFFDIGANIGYYSLVAHAFNPQIQITCFEPLPSIFAYLNKNLQANGISAQVHNLALSDKIGELEFYSVIRENFSDIDEHLNGEGTLNLELVKNRQLKTYKVQSLTLDEFMLKHPGNLPDLMKLDTEATEHLILKGASETLYRSKPVIFCEVLPGMHDKDIAIELNRHGYLFFRIYKDYLLETSSLSHDIPTERDYVFVHRDQVDKLRKRREIR